MDSLTAFFLTISGSIIAGIVVHLIRIYILERQSPFPIINGIKPQGNYKYLEGTWYQYHITRDSHQNKGEPCWSKDVWELRVTDGFRVRGTLKVETTHQPQEYFMVGEVREGRLLMTGSSRQAPQDFFTAIFPDLIVLGSYDPMIGAMMAFDYQGDFYIGPMILHKLPDLNAAELNRIMAELAHPEKPVDYFAPGKRQANKMLPEIIHQNKAQEA